MVAAITNWLKQAEPDFSVGFSLFCQHSPNRMLQDWIRRKRDMEMLKCELGKLNAILDDIPATGQPLQVESPVVEEFQELPKAAGKAVEEAAGKAPAAGERIVFKTYDERRTRRADLPPDLQAVYDHISEDYRLRRALHEKMKLATTDRDRASFRGRILEAQKQITDGWKRIDGYLRENSQKAIAANFNESSCRSYISKALKKQTLTAKVADGVRIRVKALLEHGCTIGGDTLQQLKDRGLTK